MLDHLPKPIRRSPLRQFFGRWFYVSKRLFEQQFFWKKTARKRLATSLASLVFEHRTPLLRKLKAVEMELQTNKITNLKLAADRIDGLLIRPGETFSFWFLVGRPSKMRGFLDGLVLENGKIGRGTGGGLCQMGNLLHWMFLHSPLTVVERWRHSFDVFPDEKRLLPFGSGATLAYNHVDLRVKNQTSQTFQIRLFLDEKDLRGEIRAAEPTAFRYEIIEANHFFRTEWWGGHSRHNRLERLVFDQEKHVLIRREAVLQNAALVMYSPFLSAESDIKSSAES